MKNGKMMIAVLAALVAGRSFAQEISIDILPGQQESGIAFGEAGWGGNGCPGGSEIQLNVDEESRHLDYAPSAWVYAGGQSGKTIDRASCNLSLGFKLDAGKRLRVFRQHQFGYVAVSASAQARLHQEVFLAGDTGPSIDAQLQPDDSEFHLKGETDLVSACGETGTLRVNSAVTAIARGQTYSLIGLEVVSLRFKVEDCE